MIATITREKKKRGFGSLLNQFSKADTSDQLVSLAPIAETQTASLIERLNRMIGGGVTFDVGTNDFQVCGSDRLSGAERIFLAAGKTYILYTLQQSLLMKYLSLDDVEMFVDEIRERAAILTDGEGVEPPFAIARDVTSEWFADLIDEMSNSETNLIYERESRGGDAL